MSQIDVYNYLKNQRLLGNGGYHSITSVYRAMIDMKNADAPTRRSVWMAIKKLEHNGYLDVEGIGRWPSYFRLKEKYALEEKLEKPLDNQT